MNLEGQSTLFLTRWMHSLTKVILTCVPSPLLIVQQSKRDSQTWSPLWQKNFNNSPRDVAKWRHFGSNGAFGKGWTRWGPSIPLVYYSLPLHSRRLKLGDIWEFFTWIKFEAFHRMVSTWTAFGKLSQRGLGDGFRFANRTFFLCIL